MAYQVNNQNPTAIWQGIWAGLFNQIFQEMTKKDFLAAWEATQLLITQIPPECEDDIKNEIQKIKKIVNTPIEAYTTQQLQRNKEQVINQKLPPALLELFSAIKKSLYNKNWINKDFSVKPRAGTANIEVPE